MSRQIIKQPNGKYCIYSTIIDNVIDYNLTRKEVIESFVQYEKHKLEERLPTVLDQLDKGEKPYYNFTLPFNDIFIVLRAEHGEKYANELRERMLKK